MIVKDKLQLVSETCCLCNTTIPKGAMVVRRVENGHIVCVPCLVDIAEVRNA